MPGPAQTWEVLTYKDAWSNVVRAIWGNQLFAGSISLGPPYTFTATWSVVDGLDYFEVVLTSGSLPSVNDLAIRILNTVTTGDPTIADMIPDDWCDPWPWSAKAYAGGGPFATEADWLAAYSSVIMACKVGWLDRAGATVTSGTVTTTTLAGNYGWVFDCWMLADNGAERVGWWESASIGYTNFTTFEEHVVTGGVAVGFNGRSTSTAVPGLDRLVAAMEAIATRNISMSLNHGQAGFSMEGGVITGP